MGVKFETRNGYKYRIKQGYLYFKGCNFGISVEAIIRKYGSIENYLDNYKDVEVKGL